MAAPYEHPLHTVSATLIRLIRKEHNTMPNIHCKVCHMEFSDENTICPGCGRQVDQAHPPATEPEPPATPEPAAGDVPEPPPDAPGAVEPEQPA